MIPATVDEYIVNAPEAAQAHAKEIRAIIKQSAPQALEKLSYGMPYYSLKGRLIYWGAYKDYIGLYVMGDAREALTKEIEPYRKAKATLHFPLNKPLPTQLIKDIVKVQAEANEARHAK